MCSTCMSLSLNIAIILIYQLKADSEYEVNKIFKKDCCVLKFPHLLDYKYFYTW